MKRMTSANTGGTPLIGVPAASQFKLAALYESHQVILENNMKKISKTAGALGLVGFAVLSSPFALAEDSNWYVGGNLGQSRTTIDDARINSYLAGAGLTSSSIADDNRGNAYKLFTGYQLNRNFALEAGYFDLGEFGYTATTVPAGTRVGKIKLKGLNFDLVGLIPLTEKISAFGRLGLNYAQAKDNFTSTGAVPASLAASPGKNAANYEAGMGLQYDFTKSFGMRAEAERYRINDAVGNDGDVNMFSLGLIYRFGNKAPTNAQKPVPLRAAGAPLLIIVPVVKTQQYCSILDIQFEIKKDEIQREEKEKLAVVGTFMNKYPDTTAVIEGHTDNVGGSDFNMKLSQRRAQSVVSYLVDNHHINPSRLTAKGYGESLPIGDNNTTEGQQANRRINAVIACARDIAGLKVAPARVTMAMEMDFDPYKSGIEPQYYDGLHEVANFMRVNPAVTATVEGHAAKMVGNEQLSSAQSMEISSRRAQKVVDYLVEKEGISRSRLSAEAFGRTRRVDYGTSLEGQMENRRVNIIFNYPK
jgi:OOP family OmpA-OmpF porin